MTSMLLVLAMGKVYCRGINAPDTPSVSKVKSRNEPGPCFKCDGLYYPNKCRKNKGHSSSKFQSNSYKFHKKLQ